MTINTQPAEKQVRGGLFLEVNDIFDTIQGEGPFSGVGATFIRLAGCNLQCTWCDTEYTARQARSLQDIVALSNERLVVITGGEPMRQEIAPLVHLLEQAGHTVQIETNGVLWSTGIEETNAVLVVSPKTSKVHPNVYICQKTGQMVVYVKVVVGEHAYPTQPDSKGGDVLDSFTAMYVLPLDSGELEQNKLNEQMAVDYAMKNNGIFQIQLHKYLGVK